MKLVRVLLPLIVFIILLDSAASFAPLVAAKPSTVSDEMKNCVDQTARLGNVSLNICTLKVHYRFGETVYFVGVFSNSGSVPVVLYVSSGIAVFDRLGALRFRLVSLEFCVQVQNCTLEPGSTRIDTFAIWETSAPFTGATVSGPYTAIVSASACLSTGPCLEANPSPLTIKVSVPHS